MAKKINITLSEELLERLENYCEQNYLTKSGVMAMSLTDYLNAREMQTCIKSISLAFEKLNNALDQGENDEVKKSNAIAEVTEKMQEFQNVMKILGFK